MSAARREGPHQPAAGRQGRPAESGALVLVLGGVRSGKSAVAERLAAGWASEVVYIATGLADDAEMAARIAAHRARRPPTWRTLEEPREPTRALARAGTPGVALLDSLTMLAANALAAPDDASARLARIADELTDLVRRQGWRIVVVSDEVGLGGVPLTPLGRQFADLLGDLNQRLAAAADRVLYVVAGLAVDVRALAIQSAASEPIEPSG